MSVPVRVVISIDPCCDRMKYLSDILQQARNLNLNEEYILAVENLILMLMPLVYAQDETQIISNYDTNIDNIITLRNSAFEEWKNEIKNRITPVRKTEPGEILPLE